jgi:hypothetical protein
MECLKAFLPPRQSPYPVIVKLCGASLGHELWNPGFAANGKSVGRDRGVTRLAAILSRSVL